MITTEKRREVLDEQRKQLELQYQRILGAIEVCEDIINGTETEKIIKDKKSDTKKKAIK